MNDDNAPYLNSNSNNIPKKTKVKHKNPFKSMKNNANDLVAKVGRGANIAKNYIRHAINDHKQSRGR